ncbi:hypothetical protein K2173_004346 [Erythroxylum novogranatense]|uniref:Uncharacterized protein n=1 Tax=Erythroxylum novogranatense TaxID=1862640 RepID=A0AAV8T5N9_9ROSI|nr:hypothetical protein K2173_004346 [Erythroxylum novogranatense]
MGFSLAEAFVLLQLSLFCFTVFGEETEAVPPIPPHRHGNFPGPAMAPTHHHHHHHHAHAPSYHHHHHHGHPPSHSPIYPPKLSPMPPSHPPIHPPKPSAPLPPVKPPTKPLPPVKPPTKPLPPVKPPTKPLPPVKPPTKPLPPVHPPTKPPVFPPYHYPRSFVAVQGVVYCKSCKYVGVGTLLGAEPLPGAMVKLQCNNTKYPLVTKAATDKNGYFFLEAPKTITNYGAHKCKVSLLSSPNTTCDIPSDLHGGKTGGSLRPGKPFVVNKLPFVLFTVGPFAYEPRCPR